MFLRTKNNGRVSVEQNIANFLSAVDDNKDDSNDNDRHQTLNAKLKNSFAARIHLTYIC